MVRNDTNREVEKIIKKYRGTEKYKGTENKCIIDRGIEIIKL